MRSISFPFFSFASAVLTVAVLAFSAPAMAQAKGGGDAVSFIQNMGDRGLSFLTADKMSQAQKKAEFRDLLQDSFDMNTIGRFALGRYWRVATPEQQKEYLRLFNDMIVEIYSRRFNDYDGQKFAVRGGRTVEGGAQLVHTVIVQPNGTEVSVDWRVRNRNGANKIVDVVIEGVSMIVTQRSDFASVIERGGGNVDVLLQHLRNRKNAPTKPITVKDPIP